MFGSVVLDVAVGMIFVFLLLSLIASTLHEILATLVQARAANLFRGIFSLFSGGQFFPQEGDPVSFVQKLYTHGLIQGLYRSAEDFSSLPTSVKTEVIAEHKAARAGTLGRLRAGLAVIRVGIIKRLARLMRVAWIPHLDWAPHVSDMPAYIPSRTFALALVDILNVNNETGKQAVAGVRAYLIAAATRNPEDKTTEALLALAVDAGDNINRLKGNFENWYNDAMDRVSGWYKKNTQSVLLVIGLLLAIAFNVNSIEVAQVLWFDRDVRQTLVDEADKMHSTHERAEQQAGTANPEKLGEDISAFRTATADLYPVGWHGAPALHVVGNSWLETRALWFHLLTVASGWLITALAVSLGAPFWFDLLNRFMVVRGTVKPQEKSQVEESKDPAPPPKPVTPAGGAGGSQEAAA